MARKTWDPEKSDRLVDTIEEFNRLVRTEEIDPYYVRPYDLTKFGGDLAKLVFFFRRDRSGWAKELFPNTDNDEVGWESFLEFAQSMCDVPLSSGKRRSVKPLKHRRYELDLIRQTQRELETGTINSSDDAVNQLIELGIQLTPSQISTYFPAYHIRGNGNGDGNGHNDSRINGKTKTLEQRIVSLQHRRKTPEKPRDFGKVRIKNPYFMLGNVYQNLVGTLLTLAHLDDRVIPEVALSFERDEEGNLSRTYNIADFVVLEGAHPNKKRREEIGKEPRATIYEIKLGRQRVGLRRQVEGQLEAARARGWSNVSSYVIAGSERGTEQGRVVDEEKHHLESLQAIFEGNPDVEIGYFKDLLEKARSELLRKAGMLKDSRIAEEWAREDPEGLKRFIRKEYDGNDAQFESEMNQKYRETINVGIDLLGSTFQIINLAVQRRYLPPEAIQELDENLYLMQYFVNKRLRKDLKPSRLKKQSASRSTISSLTQAIVKAAPPIIDVLRGYDSGIKETLLSEGTREKYEERTRRSYLRGFNFVNRAFRFLGKPEAPIPDESETASKLFGLRPEQIWAKYLSMTPKEVREKILNKRNRMEIRFEEHGIYSEFSVGTRVISKNPRDWLLSQLEDIGIPIQNLDLKDPRTLERAVAQIENYFEESDAFNSDTASRLKSQLEERVKYLEAGEVVERDINLPNFTNVLDEYGLGGKKLNFMGLRGQLYFDSWYALRKKLAFNFKKGFCKLTGIKYKPNAEETALEASDWQSKYKRRLRDYIKPREIFLAFSKRQDRVKRDIEVIEIYKDFMSKEPDLVLLEARLIGFLGRYNSPISRDVRYKPIEGTNQHVIYRSRLDRHFNFANRYAAAKMLHAVRVTKTIAAYDQAKARDYFKTVGREWTVGTDLGSQEIIDNVVKDMKEAISDESKLKVHYGLVV